MDRKKADIRTSRKQVVTGLVGYRDYGAYGEIYDEYWTNSTYKAYFGTAGLGYGTEYRDETGLIYYGVRYYHPTLGRFISRDPLKEAGSGANLYAFCGNDPINRRELYGLCDDGARPQSSNSSSS